MNAVKHVQNNDLSFADRFDSLAQAVPTIPSHSEDPADLQKALRLSGILQTTLETNKLIELFAHELIKLVSYQHIKYSNPALEMEQEIGIAASNSCNYRLVVSGETLGELTLGRKTAFTKQETNLIETLLCGLVYPLRNSLMYYKALEAAHKDPLTGINNRASMDEVMDREVNLAGRYGNDLSLLAVDIDYFKRINDTHGHAIGDCVIKAVAEAASSTIRSCDMVFRYGGEEFIVLLSNTDREGAMQMAERLRQKIEETCIICDGVQVSATVSVGITCLTADDSRSAMFSRADAALYQAKAGGRNCCRFFSKDAD